MMLDEITSDAKIMLIHVIGKFDEPVRHGRIPNRRGTPRASKQGSAAANFLDACYKDAGTGCTRTRLVTGNHMSAGPCEWVAPLGSFQMQ